MTTDERRAMDELKGAVSSLADRVRRSVLSEGDVESIVQDLLSGQRRVAQNARRGYQPGDYDESFGAVDTPGTIFELGAPDRQALAKGGRDRVYEIHGSYPGKVAEALGVKEQAVRDRHAITDTLVLAATYLGKEPQELDYYRDAYEPTIQAMDSATAAEGLEYVPRELSASLIERVNLELRVASLFPQVQMPSQPFDIPGLAVSRQRTATKAQETADTGQGKFEKRTPATRKITLTAIKFGAEVIVSKEMEEDSLIAVVPMIQSELVDWLSADIEDAIINGDDAAAHQDSDVTDFTDPADPRTAWNGLRFLTQAAQKTDASNAVLTSAMLRTNRSKMGKYGVRADQLAHIIAMRSYINLLSDANVQTLEKYGPNATILSGELGRIDGAPIVVSEFVRQDLNASGVHDGVTTTRTIALTVNRAGFLVGQRRGVTVQVLRELYAESDQDAIIASLRKAFMPRFPTTEGIVALTFNVA
jgi:HK97 family phage major capsid protein